MTNDSHPDSLPGRREAQALLFFCIAVAGSILAVVVREPPPAVLTALIYVLPLALVAAVWVAIRLSRAGAADVPTGLFAAGLAFLVGGPLLDVGATVFHSPDLSQEGNPIVRSLLDTGHRLPFVYAYGAVGQTLDVVLLCTLWAGLLRHRRSIVASVQPAESPMAAIKAATGGAELTWRQWLFPLRTSELPEAYHLMWVVAVVLLAGSIDRWYLGLEWFGVVGSSRWIVLACGITAGLGAYFLWIYLAACRLPDAESITQSPAETLPATGDP